MFLGIFVIIFILLFQRRLLIIDKKRAFIIGVVGLIILFSGYINADIMSVPRNENISSNLYQNFASPSFLFLYAICQPNRSGRSSYQKITWIIGILGFIWLSYTSLHYLIGFHNPYWENLGLSIKDVYGF